MGRTCLDDGFPTVMGRGLFGEFKHFVNPPFLIVTMPDLWALFAHAFQGADYRLYLTDSIEMADLDRDAAALTGIRAMTDQGIDALVDGLKWGTSFQGSGWCPRHIEGTDHFLFYTLEKQTGRKFLHGQPVGLGIVTGCLLHDQGADQMLDTIAGIGLDVRPQAMGLTWDQAAEGLTGMRDYIRTLPLWHSLAHDAPITPGFVADLKQRLDRAYAHRGD